MDHGGQNHRKWQSGLGQGMEKFVVLNGQEFRSDVLEQPAGAELIPSPRAVRVLEDLFEFCSDTFATDKLDTFRGIFNGAACGLVEGEFVARSESNRSEHTKLIFADPRIGISNGPQVPLAQVFLPSDKIDYFLRDWIVEQTVDRKVSSLSVFLGRRILDPIRSATIGIGTVGSKGSHLDLATLLSKSSMDQYHAKGFANGPRVVGSEYFSNLVGGGARGYVEIFWCKAEQGIAHTSPGVISDKPRSTNRRTIS